MSTIDLSRLTTDFRKHFTGVRMQQGRVLTDDDFNEAHVLGAEDQRRTRAHIIGTLGSPDDGFLPKGFVDTGGRVTFTLSAGSLYLGGHRLELNTDQLFHLQTDWLNFDPGAEMPPIPPPNSTRRDLVWIEVWEQPVTATEDATLFEVALGGPDTSARMRLVPRVRVRPGVIATTCEQAWIEVASGFAATEGVLNEERELTGTARLRVAFNTLAAPGDLCTPSTSGGYLGAENQAIRVQLVDATHYTWGFDNAAPLYRVRVARDNQTLTLVTPPRDAAHWPLANQVVEVLAWSSALPNGQRLAELSGPLAKVGQSYDPDTQTLVLATALPATLNTRATARSDRAQYWNGTSADSYLYLRVWNRGDDLASPASIPLPVSATDPNGRLGTTGYSVTFLGTPLRPNDYWVITARPAAPDRILPFELASAGGAPPPGVRRFRAPIALVEWTLANGVLLGTVRHDCRRRFRPLVEIRCCDPLVAKPGWGWERVFDAIPDGSDATICFPPGDYPLTETVYVQRKGRLLITGAGPATRIFANLTERLLQFSDCDRVDIRDLYCFGGNRHEPGIAGTLTFDDVRDLRLKSVAVRCKAGRGRELACVRVSNPLAGPDKRFSGTVRVEECHFYVGHLQTGLLVTNASSVMVRTCRFLPSGTSVESVQHALKSKHFLSVLAHSSVLSVGDADPAGQRNQRFSAAGRDSARLTFGCDETLRPFWQEFVAQDRVLRALAAHAVGQRGMARSWLVRRFRGILESGPRRDRGAVRDWLRAIDADARTVIGQAIVVGGQRADQVVIENNQVVDATQGIHVGLSHSTANRTRAGADIAGRVVIRQNRVACTIAAGAAGERHAIFVGNARSTAVFDNDIVSTHLDGVRHLPVDGIRLFGFLGEMAQVRTNHIEGFTVPIRVQQRGMTPANASRIVEWNYPNVPI